ncbi:hypothetical protein H4R21_002884 [Coemansia helicoidea]|uniref:Uncharacterized protein n=1 Tax=Coemansia helicoidea TaxID=1286919 RepID=A0ACC1L575_9FUNG|nr:hypothetical protein H4R21_002884 [Coemansia helicoidea]
MPDDESEDLKRQIQQLELAIQQRKQGPRKWTSARYNPVRPRAPYRPPVRPSRNLKLTVREAPKAGGGGGGGSSEGASSGATEGYLSYGNKLVRVASGAAPLRPVLRPPAKARAPPRRPARVVIEGETYIRRSGGNKLVRAAALAPPRAPVQQRRVVSIDGEDYVRTKRGTLLRVAAVRELNKRRGQRHPRTDPQQHPHRTRRQRLCTHYLFGKCDRAADECHYSHTLSAETTPVCQHFQHDACTRAGCRFSHVKVNPGAPICRDFVFSGWCAKGAKCLHRHVLECPDWVEKGKCPRARCRLPHPDPSRPRYAAQLPTAEEEEAFMRRYIQRPTFDDAPADPGESSDGDSSSSAELDDALSDDEADELLKWYDDNYDEAADN